MSAGTAFIGLGSNLGGRIANLNAALDGLGTVNGVIIAAVSGIYETSPVQADGGYFLNAVARVETTLDPGQLLKELLRVESALGRVRRQGNKDARNIDLDLLLYGDTVVEGEDLVLPHPRMLARRFVMEPLSELDPDLLIPGSGKTASKASEKLGEICPEQKIVRLGTLEEIED